MVIIHDHSQYLLSFSIIIDRRIFWFSYSNLSQDYRTIYTTYPTCLTKSSNKIVAIFLYHVSVFAIKQEKHLTGGGGGAAHSTNYSLSERGMIECKVKDKTQS